MGRTVHPYRARDAAHTLRRKLLRTEIDGRKAIKNFVKATGQGLKNDVQMGISTYMSYTGAQIFEAWPRDRS